MHDPLAERAWQGLYLGEPKKELLVRYTGRLKGYNAQVRSDARATTFSLSRGLEEASEEVRIGVMQQLLNRLNKTRIDTLEIQLYTSFIKKLTEYNVTDRVDPVLKGRFDIINASYFDGFMMTPNLIWGSYSLTRLGHYTYGTDTIVLSTALREDEEMLDYVLYHELLHKKHKFSERAGGFARSHTKAFREDERRFRMKDGSDPEKRLAAFVRQRRTRRAVRQAPSRGSLLRFLGFQ